MPDNLEYAPTVAWFPMVAHKVYKRTYNISAGLNYVSVKDQVVRACALIDGLVASNVLTNGPDQPDTWDLVVVGAGAAGVSAAWRAAEKGMKVLVAEQADHPFPAQKASAHRRISFSMYDWPEPFAGIERFPSLDQKPIAGLASNEHEFPCFSDSDEPLPASEYAERWTRRLGIGSGSPSPSTAKHTINWNFETRAEPQKLPESGLAPDHGYIYVNLNKGGSVKQIMARNVVVATGIGLERSIGDFRPQPFWEEDDEAPWSMVPEKGNETVVVSGAGDGAIQDVLKSLFRADPGSLIPLAEELLTTKRAEKKQAILAAERHAERQLLWGVHDAQVYERLQTVYQEIVIKVGKARLKEWRAKHFREAPIIDWVVGSNNFFSKAYPLNRLLGTVLRRPEFRNQVKIHQGRLLSIRGSKSGGWECTIEGGKTLRSTYRPLVRHGVEVGDIAYSADYDRNAIRVALSRAPVPFKPFDF